MGSAATQMDLAISDVHAPAAGSDDPHQKVPMAEISTEKRNSLPSSSFGDPEERKYPLPDKAHADNAMSRLEQQKGSMSSSKYNAIKRRIRAAQKRYGESPKEATDKTPSDRRGRVAKSIHVRADLAPGGALHVRHMSYDGTRTVETFGDGSHCLRDTRRIVSGDEVVPSEVGIKLVGPTTWKDGSAKSLVWVQVAEIGQWKGHGAGPFEMTSKTFDECVANFNARALPVQWDMEHASEADATSGTIPVTGAPAQGWIHRLENREVAGLWALTEWLDYARDGIKAGNFAWCSPAIRFGSRDGVTGKDIGARLTSCAITGSPFLTGLAGLVAAKDTQTGSGAAYRIAGGPKELLALMSVGAGSAFAHKPHEYMPAVKQALGLHDLCMSQECSRRLNELRDHVEACGDAEGMHHGVDLGQYTRPLRDLVDAQPGDTWDDVFDAVEGLIQAAIADHEAKFHAGQHPALNSAGHALDDDGDFEMSDAEKAELTKLKTEKEDLTTKLSEVTGKLKAAEERASTAEGIVTSLRTAIGAVLLKDNGDSPATVVTKLVEENKRLLDEKVKREEADLNADVEIAFATYREIKKLNDGDKVHMLAIAKANRQAFNGLYPPVPPDQRHLLRSSPPERRPDPEDEQSYSTLVKKLMSDKGMSYSDACVEAAKILKDKDKGSK